MMLTMFVNDRRDNWDELLLYVMHSDRTSVHESTGYSPFRLMKCSLPQDVSTSELTGNMINHHTHLRLGSAMRWRSLIITFENHFIGLPPDINGYTMLRL